MHVSDTAQWQTKITYGYDDPTKIESLPAAPTRHDPSFNTSFLTRGNVTSVSRWDVTDIDNSAKELKTEISYNITGSVIRTKDPANHFQTLSYSDSFSDNQNGRNTFAYPTTATDADGSSSYAQYNFDFGAVTRTQGPPVGQSEGAIQTMTYDAVGRIQWLNNVNNGALAERLEFDPLGNDIPLTDPNSAEPPDYLFVKNYDVSGNPYDGPSGCALDGAPVPCSIMMNMLRFGTGVGRDGGPISFLARDVGWRSRFDGQYPYSLGVIRIPGDQISDHNYGKVTANDRDLAKNAMLKYEECVKRAFKGQTSIRVSGTYKGTTKSEVKGVPDWSSTYNILAATGNNNYIAPMLAAIWSHESDFAQNPSGGDIGPLQFTGLWHRGGKEDLSVSDAAWGNQLVNGKILNNKQAYNGNLEDHLATGRNIIHYSLARYGGNQRDVYKWYGPGHTADNPYGPLAKKNRNIYADQLLGLQSAYQELFDCLTGAQ